MKKIVGLTLALIMTISLLFVTFGCTGEPSPVPAPVPAPTPTPKPALPPAPAPIPDPIPDPRPALTPEPSVVPHPVALEPEALLLSNALKRGCERSRPSGGFENVGLAVGETAVNFELKDIHGNTVSLAGLLSEKPVVMVFGSFT